MECIYLVNIQVGKYLERREEVGGAGVEILFGSGTRTGEESASYERNCTEERQFLRRQTDRQTGKSTSLY